jgi:N-acetylgalactosamine-N,N'-diacetylbacillosaminyl-diphospho-undecaprenol 4-alpha-N-acetylgalactosaminyltransferase
MSNHHSDITLLINSLGEGGAQRVVVTLAKQFVKEGKKVTLLSLAKNDLYDLPPEVKRVYFTNKSRDSMLLIPYYAWKLRKYVKFTKTSVVQSYLFRANYVNILSKILGSKHLVQVSNRSVVSRFLSEGVSGKINLLLIKLLYGKADLIMYVSQRMKQDLHEHFNIRKDEVVIYNPYDIDRILSDAEKQVNNFTFKKEKRYLVTVGRLISLKRFQDVIEVMQELPNDVELILLGDGNEK